ncbi:MAG: MFS transporter [Oscillospiraceae bacterium]|nr:MFS transporter [Oscillospiraceae bacterium]
MEDKRITRRNLIMFPLGTVGRDMVYNLFAYNLATFVFYTRQLTALQMSVITAIMVAARVFDALNDPVMGNIIERTRTRWGKFKPWLVIGILSTSVVIYLTFSTTLQGWPFVVFFGVMYFLFSITYTMNDISFWGMIPALSSDADTRNKFTSRATLFAGIGGMTASALIPVFTTGENAIGGSAVTAYAVVALVIAIFAPLCLCFTVFGVKEQRSYDKEPAPPVSFKKIWTTITGNDQLLWISLIFLIQQIGNGIVISDIGKNYIYFDFGYSGGLFGTFQILGMVVTGFLMIFYPAISRHMRRKKLMDLLMIVSAVGYAVMLLDGLFMPKGLAAVAGFDLKFLLVTLGYMLANFGQYGFYLIMMISIMNTVEYNELKHGTRDEGIVSSLRPFLTKLASALTIAVANGSIIAFGLMDFTNRIAEQEQLAERLVISTEEKTAAIEQLLTGVQPGQVSSMILVMTVAPCLLMFLSYVLYKKHYTLDEDEYDEVCRQIEARKAGV